jgi:hypothetical protein
LKFFANGQDFIGLRGRPIADLAFTRFLYVLPRKILQQLVNPEEKLVISFE